MSSQSIYHPRKHGKHDLYIQESTKAPFRPYLSRTLISDIRKPGLTDVLARSYSTNRSSELSLSSVRLPRRLDVEQASFQGLGV